MYVHITDPSAVQSVTLDEGKCLVRIGHGRHGEVLEQLEHCGAIGEMATGELANDEGVNDHARAVEQRDELRVTAAQVVHPHRRINQDQDFGSERLRRAALKPGSVPPSLASRRALSR